MNTTLMAFLVTFQESIPRNMEDAEKLIASMTSLIHLPTVDKIKDFLRRPNKYASGPEYLPPLFYKFGVNLYLDVVEVVSGLGARSIEILAKRDHKRNHSDLDFYNKAQWVNRVALHSASSYLFIGITLPLGAVGAIARIAQTLFLSLNRVLEKEIPYKSKQGAHLLSTAIPVAGIAAAGLFAGQMTVLNITALAVAGLAALVVGKS